MEKRLNRKIEEYYINFKNALKAEVTSRNIPDDDKHGIMKFIYNYENLCLEKNDLQKRKRTKNVVPFHDRCTALRANKEQCTRRKKGDNKYCGTHIKGQPHGTLELSSDQMVTSKKVEVWPEEIYGIIYYIDNNNNVYSAEDIMSNRDNPKVIYKYNKDNNGNYHIEDLVCPKVTSG